MDQTASTRLAGVFLLVVVTAGAISAQDSPGHKVFPNIHPSQKGVLPCVPGVNYETEKYHIGKIELDDPFKFLYWVGGEVDRIETQLAEKFKANDNLFTYKMVRADALASIE